jgi:phage tail protein X
MKVATFQGETSLDALTTRLYGDAAKTHPELRERLLNENPHLSDLTKVAEGTLIVVPENGVSAPDPIDPRTAATITMSDIVLNGLQARRLEKLAQRQETLTQLQKQVSDPHVVETVKAADPGSVDRLTVIGSAAAAALKDVEDQKKELANSIALAKQTVRGGGRRRAVG